jgi:hypothetical protein
VTSGLVHLRTSDGRRYIALAAREDGGELVIEAPQEHGFPWQPPPGEPLDVGWATPKGMVWCSAVVRQPNGDPGPGPVVPLRLLSAPVATNRRAHTRVPVEFDVELQRGGGLEPVRGRCADVGAGGLQASLPVEIPVGDVVRLRVYAADGDPFGVTAKVVRRVGESRVGFVFELVVEGSRERLVRQAFDQAARTHPDRPA